MCPRTEPCGIPGIPELTETCSDIDPLVAYNSLHPVRQERINPIKYLSLNAIIF